MNNFLCGLGTTYGHLFEPAIMKTPKMCDFFKKNLIKCTVFAEQNYSTFMHSKLLFLYNFQRLEVKFCDI